MPSIEEKLVRLSGQELSRVYQNVFNSDEGQIVLEDLRNRCYVKIPTFSGEDLNNLHSRMMINEGARSVFLHIETQLNPITEEKQNV